MSASKQNEAVRLFAAGLEHQQAGRLAEARKCYERGLKLVPGHPDALFLLGQTLFDSGEREIGERKMRAAIDARPQAANYRAGLAISLFNAGQPAEAAKEFAAAVRHLHGDPSLWRGLALSAAQSGDTPTAYDAATRWAALQPSDEEASGLTRKLAAQSHHDRAKALAEDGRYEEACTAYAEALRQDPGGLPILVNLANLYVTLKRHDEAQVLFARAIALDPNSAAAHFNLGMLHLDVGRRLDAARSLADAARCDPQDGLIAAHLLFQKMHLCAWEGLEPLSRHVMAAVEKNTADIPPFIVLSMPGTTPALQRKCAENHSLRLRRADDAALPLESRRPGRLRVGYLSSDFKNHATAFLMIDMLEAHDRSRFETFGLSYGIDDASTMRRRVESSFEHFVELAGLPARDAVQRIRAQELDILIDLKGYTEGNRSDWLQYRLAPVQINWLGYPGTLGAPWVDYLIADEVVAPSGNQWMFSERLLHLPGCYQPNCRAREVLSVPPTRAQEGLPDDAIVLCSFNQTYKITPELFDVWMAVLRDVPRAVLWLWASNPWAEKALRREAEARGVAAERLIFAEGRPQAMHLARLPLADLALDTFPCNGHTTTSDALWAGVPVVTLRGEAFAARVAASLLVTAGFRELVAETHEQYAEIVLDFCRDTGRRFALQRRMRELRENSEVFDGTAFARKIEALLEEVAVHAIPAKQPGL